MTALKMFPDSVVPLPKSGITPNGMVVNAVLPVNLGEKRRLHFSLQPDQASEDELEARVARGEVVSNDELNGKYAVKKADTEALTNWLTEQGYDIHEVTPDGTSVYADATLDKVQSSLGVHMVRVTTDGSTVTAASNAPGLPQEVGAAVQHIGGLQPFVRLQKRLRKAHFPPAAAAVTLSDGYDVAQILAAYNADRLGLTGDGQEIAILIDTFAIDADLEQFWTINKIQNSVADNIVKVNVGGGPLPSVEGEESLDTEWTSGIAPSAKIRVYASGGLDFTSLDQALDRIIADAEERPGLRQVSISLGIGETYLNGPSGEIATQHQKYLRLAARGVNVFVSSGDAGSNPGRSGHLANGVLQAEYAAADPCVVAVGGTSLILDGAGAVTSETGWSAGGGGISHYFARPSWQSGVGGSATKRMVPDVSLTADPQHGGLLVVNGAPLTGGIGGTSWSAPVWAAFCALINEGRTKAGKEALPFLNPLIYPLLGSSAFRDITAGSNGAYNASPGYDMVTGLGVPNLAALAKALG